MFRKLFHFENVQIANALLLSISQVQDPESRTPYKD